MLHKQAPANYSEIWNDFCLFLLFVYFCNQKHQNIWASPVVVPQAQDLLT